MQGKNYTCHGSKGPKDSGPTYSVPKDCSVFPSYPTYILGKVGCQGRQLCAMVSCCCNTRMLKPRFRSPEATVKSRARCRRSVIFSVTHQQVVPPPEPFERTVGRPVAADPISLSASRAQPRHVPVNFAD